MGIVGLWPLGKNVPPGWKIIFFFFAAAALSSFSPLLLAMAHMSDYHSINGNESGEYDARGGEFGQELSESRQRNTRYEDSF